MLSKSQIELLQKSLRIHRKVADLILCLESDSSVSPTLFSGLEEQLGRLSQDADSRLKAMFQLQEAMRFAECDASPAILSQIRRHLSVAIATLEKMP